MPTRSNDMAARRRFGIQGCWKPLSIGRRLYYAALIEEAAALWESLA
jgi:hypothetical protein